MFSVIIIDDEKIARQTLEKYCKEYAKQFEVISSFSNGEAAIEYLKDNSVDIVFSDIKMPGMSGIDVAKWIYENKPKTKIVMVSGYSDFHYAQEAIKYKVSYYLLKVIDISEFKEVVRVLEKELSDKGRDDYFEIEMFFCNLFCGFFDSEKIMESKFNRITKASVDSVLCRCITVSFDSLMAFNEKHRYDKEMFYTVLTNIIRTAHNQCFIMPIKQDECKCEYILMLPKKEHFASMSKKIEGLVSDIMGVNTIVDEEDISLTDLYKRNSMIDKAEKEKIIKSQSIDVVYGEKEKFIKEVMKYIDDNYSSGITVSDIANKFYTNRIYLTRQFNEVTGQNVSEYIMDLRMKKAIECISENISVEKTCLMIGYADERSFRRLFKRYTGKTIKEYKNDLKGD